MSKKGYKVINVVVVGGIRTHYIKINAIQKVLKLYPEITDKVNVIYVDVSQHYDKALTYFKEELDLSFDYVLHHDTTDSFGRASSIFYKVGQLFEEIGAKSKIDFVVVMGDVATTMIVAMAAVMKQLKIAHIEAGVRIARGNGIEEYYRTATDHISSVCFVSTQDDYVNLQREAFNARAVFTGDIIYDYIKDCAPTINKKMFYYGACGELVPFNCNESDYILFSLHHVENLSYDNLQNTFTAVNRTGRRSIFIAHPRVKRLLQELSVNTYDTIIADYVPYLDNLIAIANCRFVLTDSGGIQREAFYFNKRCIVRSDLTVWQSIVNIGSNVKCDSDIDSLENAIAYAESNADKKYDCKNIFGNGTAVKTIFESLIKASDVK